MLLTQSTKEKFDGEPLSYEPTDVEAYFQTTERGTERELV